MIFELKGRRNQTYLSFHRFPPPLRKIQTCIMKAHSKGTFTAIPDLGEQKEEEINGCILKYIHEYNQ